MREEGEKLKRVKKEEGEKLKRVKKTHLWLLVLNRLPISPNANQLILFFFFEEKQTSAENIVSFHR